MSNAERNDEQRDRFIDQAIGVERAFPGWHAWQRFKGRIREIGIKNITEFRMSCATRTRIVDVLDSRSTSNTHTDPRAFIRLLGETIVLDEEIEHGWVTVIKKEGARLVYEEIKVFKVLKVAMKFDPELAGPPIVPGPPNPPRPEKHREVG